MDTAHTNVESHDVIHEHCSNCFLQACNHSYSKICQVIPCQSKCGAILHHCKMQDHLIICPNNIQSCTNSLYGCPFKLHKSEINAHLSVCPASTVVCTMEWNRKPLPVENTIMINCYNPNAITHNQMEVMLALRDQRVLLETLATPEILSNTFGFNSVSQKYFTSKKTEAVNCVKNSASNDKNDACKQGSNIDTKNNLLICNDSENNLIFKNDDSNESKPIKKPLLRKKFQLAPKKVYKDAKCDTSDNDIDYTNLKWLNPGIKPKGFDSTTCLFEMLGAYEKCNSISTSHYSEGLRCTLNDFRLCSFRHVATQTRPVFKTYDCIENVGNAFQEIFEHKPDQYYLSSTHNLKLSKSLALNQVMECLPRYEKKSHSIYSFMCNNLLRRDQFQSHFQNVHCEIYSNLNGWLEEKCPYAQYGCDYSLYRFYPDFSNSILYDNARSCIAVRPQSFDHFKSSETDCNKHSNLLYLPPEVLEHILNFLDSYSLGQFSETCYYIKSLCNSFLKKRGIVIKNWEKFKRIDGSTSWQMTGEKWLYSNAFTEIQKWSFSKHPFMSNHVFNCPIAAKHTIKYADGLRVKLCKT